jgi:HSP20 family protein
MDEQKRGQEKDRRSQGVEKRSGSETGRGGGEMVGPRREGLGSGPFALMRSFSEEMDRMFSGFLGSRLGSWGGDRLASRLGGGTWWPEMEVLQRSDKLVVRADMPGMSMEDVTVEVRDGALVISGERRDETEETDDTFFRRERAYGSFLRTIPLPEGAKVDTAEAKFENGVLEIEMELPDRKERAGRRIQVREASRRETAGAGRK